MKHDDQHNDWEVFDSFDGVVLPSSQKIRSATERAILIRLRDPGALARGQGATAAFAEQLAPATIEAQVYDEVANQIDAALAAKNVDADISIVEPKVWSPAGLAHVGSDIALFMGGAGLVGVIYWLFSRGKK